VIGSFRTKMTTMDKKDANKSKNNINNNFDNIGY
jgi:hypothetical protein